MSLVMENLRTSFLKDIHVFNYSLSNSPLQGQHRIIACLLVPLIPNDLTCLPRDQVPQLMYLKGMV